MEKLEAAKIISLLLEIGSYSVSSVYYEHDDELMHDQKGRKEIFEMAKKLGEDYGLEVVVTDDQDEDNDEDKEGNPVIWHDYDANLDLSSLNPVDRTKIKNWVSKTLDWLPSSIC